MACEFLHGLNGQLTMDNFGRGEKIYLKNAFVPDCINMVLILFSVISFCIVKEN